MSDSPRQIEVEMMGEKLFTLFDRCASSPSRSMVAEVFSVHERAVNLVPLEVDSEPRLLSIVTDRSSVTTNSLVLAPANRRPEALGLKQRERVSLRVELRGDSITIALSPPAGATAGRAVLRAAGDPVLYSGLIAPAAEAASNLMRLRRPGHPPAEWDRLATLAASILEIEDGTGFGGLAQLALRAGEGEAHPGSPPVAPTLAPTFAHPLAPTFAHPLANPFATRAVTLLQPAVEGATPLHELLPSLVGLGIGFTPSGDDFAAGALAAYALCGRRLSRSARDALLTRARTATTLPGSVLIDDAAAGSFPAYLSVFARAFAQTETGIGMSHRPAGASHDEAARSPGLAIRAAVEKAARHGHSSGIDALTGFLLALTITQT